MVMCMYQNRVHVKMVRCMYQNRIHVEIVRFMYQNRVHVKMFRLMYQNRVHVKVVRFMLPNTTFSNIQLYCGGQFYWWRKPGSILRKQPTYRKSITNFIIRCHLRTHYIILQLIATLMKSFLRM